MPPAAWISSSARSKPCFHCVPYCAFGPVNGPLTPSKIGSDDCASAAREKAAPAIMAASEPLTRVRRSMLLMDGSILSGVETTSNFHAGEIGYFEGSPSDSISRFAQLKNDAPL